MTLRTLGLAFAGLLIASVANADPSSRTDDEHALVHIDASREVDLEFRRGGDVDWVRVCTSPCDRVVSRDGDFRITGEDLRTSEPFAIVRGAKAVTLRVEPTSRTARALGVIGIVAGSVTTAVSFLAYERPGTGAVSVGCSFSAGCSEGALDATPYIVTAIVGGVVMLTGLGVVIAGAGGTTVTSPGVARIEEKRPNDDTPAGGIQGSIKEPAAPRIAASAPLIRFSF